MNTPAELAIFPQDFLAQTPTAPAQIYLSDELAQKLVQFFRTKGLPALKEVDRNEEWYDDWLAYQSQHKLYARLLAPKQFSTLGSELNLHRLTRFFEVFGYCSASHGYSLQVSFLGLFSILMGNNDALKRRAVADLESGGLFAFGVSEKSHGSDLLSNGFTIRESAPGQFIANGNKYYIGNANAASIITILARKEDARTARNPNRAPLALFAFRPANNKAFQNLRKIRTLGVRAAYVGEFEIKDHEFPETDIIAEGRQAWDAVFGTVALGKFFLGFGQIGICQHAFAEAAAHLKSRILYGNPAIQLPHIRSLITEAYARLTAMKLYAYRALDYVQAASETDRRYMLFTAVQKARVSTEGVKVMSLLSECIGAKGFESDTFFELALRDSQLIPGLEGSSHINLGLAAQFIPNYFQNPDGDVNLPKFNFTGPVSAASENPYLMQSTTRGTSTIRFAKYDLAYRPLHTIPNVVIFLKQATLFRLFIHHAQSRGVLLPDPETSLALGTCMATIAYAQLIAEQSLALHIPSEVISTIFHLLVRDLSVQALTIATLPKLDDAERTRIRKLMLLPQQRGADWEFAAKNLSEK